MLWPKQAYKYVVHHTRTCPFITFSPFCDTLILPYTYLYSGLDFESVVSFIYASPAPKPGRTRIATTSIFSKRSTHGADGTALVLSFLYLRESLGLWCPEPDPFAWDLCPSRHQVRQDWRPVISC